ncbi:hypothetical protein PFISCL1PPCAC_24441, partial [Pristionchus fissidentatus]
LIYAHIDLIPDLNLCFDREIIRRARGKASSSTKGIEEKIVNWMKDMPRPTCDAPPKDAEIKCRICSNNYPTKEEYEKHFSSVCTPMKELTPAPDCDWFIVACGRC